jgi:hypothetical protein
VNGNIASISGKTPYPTVSILQKTAAAMLPFYERISMDSALRSVDLLEAGFELHFRIPGVRSEYANEFFREYSG